MLSLEAHVYNNNLNIKSDALYLFLLPISNSTFKTFLLSKTFSENVTFSYAAIKTVIFFTKKVVGYFQTLMIDATFHVKSTFFFFFSLSCFFTFIFWDFIGNEFHIFKIVIGHHFSTVAMFSTVYAIQESCIYTCKKWCNVFHILKGKKMLAIINMIISLYKNVKKYYLQCRWYIQSKYIWGLSSLSARKIIETSVRSHQHGYF